LRSLAFVNYDNNVTSEGIRILADGIRNSKNLSELRIRLDISGVKGGVEQLLRSIREKVRSYSVNIALENIDNLEEYQRLNELIKRENFAKNWDITILPKQSPKISGKNREEWVFCPYYYFDCMYLHFIFIDFHYIIQ